LLLAGPAGAQSTTGPTGSFDSLSPGNQKIADALFAAQKPTGTQTTLTRDQITGLKGTEGWGRVFKQMKADGLVSARNLGQVVSQHEHQLHASTTGTTASTAGRSTGTATASGTGRSGISRTATARRGGGWHSTRFASSRWHGGGYAGGHRFASASHAMGGGYYGAGGMGGFGHGGMSGGFGGGHGGGGHGR
jgi:hypothetical protein